MTKEEIINSRSLSSVVIALITIDSSFKDSLKKEALSIASDIESAATNPNCTCRNKVVNYVIMNSTQVGALVYDFAQKTNTMENVKQLFLTSTPPEGPNVSGRVAKTTIKDWTEFAKKVIDENLRFRHMSTSIVGEEVYVFFL